MFSLTECSEIHILDEDSYYFEISGIPDYDVDDDDDSLPDIDLKKTSKVQFSKAPIRVGYH